jgi:hypothetical protein
MEKLPASGFDLEKYKKEEQIIRQTALQIIKDFAMFGLPVEFSGITQLAYDELFRQLDMHVSGLLESSSSKLHSLLYQIDVPEKKIRLAIQTSEYPSEAITTLIIDRELTKVLTRIYFKEKSGQPGNSGNPSDPKSIA